MKGRSEISDTAAVALVQAYRRYDLHMSAQSDLRSQHTDWQQLRRAWKELSNELNNTFGISITIEQWKKKISNIKTNVKMKSVVASREQSENRDSRLNWSAAELEYERLFAGASDGERSVSNVSSTSIKEGKGIDYAIDTLLAKQNETTSLTNGSLDLSGISIKAQSSLLRNHSFENARAQNKISIPNKNDFRKNNHIISSSISTERKRKISISFGSLKRKSVGRFLTENRHANSIVDVPSSPAIANSETVASTVTDLPEIIQQLFYATPAHLGLAGTAPSADASMHLLNASDTLLHQNYLQLVQTQSEAIKLQISTVEKFASAVDRFGTMITRLAALIAENNYRNNDNEILHKFDIN